MNSFLDRTFGRTQRPPGRTYRQGEKDMSGDVDGYRDIHGRGYPDDEYLLNEIARLKSQTEELRQILSDRQIQMDEINKNNNSAILKLAEALNIISEKIDKVENSLAETIENNQEIIHEDINNSIEKCCCITS